MTSKGPFQLGFLLAVAVVSAGCSDYLGEDQTPIDLSPASLTEAQRSLQRIDQLYESNPVAAMDATRKLRPRLDELNQLTARVEMAPNHFVEFYVLPHGTLVVERRPVGDARVLRDADISEHSAAELYRRLTEGATPPQSLLRAELHRAPHDDFSMSGRSEAVANSESSAGSDPDVTQSWTGTDGPHWRNVVCFRGGDFYDCLPNRTGFAHAGANTKTSFVEVAPYRGNLRLQFTYANAPRAGWPVFVGEHWSGWWQSAGNGADYHIVNHRWDVMEAEGDGFHWAFSFKWSCAFSSCNIRP